MFWLLTFKSQILVNALLASEAGFWMHNTIALIILCSATNIAFAFLKWVHDQVVELFQEGVSVLELPYTKTIVSFLRKNSLTTHV